MEPTEFFKRITNTPAKRRIYAIETAALEASEAVILAMEKQNITREELAERVGWQLSTLNRLLNGLRGWRLDELAILLVAMGHTVSVSSEQAFEKEMA